VLHEAALTREVDGVGHRDSGTKADHSVKRQDILDAILTDNHHYVVLSNSVSGQSARHPPDGVACLRKRERLARQTIDLPRYITQRVAVTFKDLISETSDLHPDLTRIYVDTLGNTLTSFLPIKDYCLCLFLGEFPTQQSSGNKDLDLYYNSGNTS